MAKGPEWKWIVMKSRLFVYGWMYGSIPTYMYVPCMCYYQLGYVNSRFSRLSDVLIFLINETTTECSTFRGTYIVAVDLTAESTADWEVKCVIGLRFGSHNRP